MSNVLAPELEEAGRELGRRLLAGGNPVELQELVGNILKAVNGNVADLKAWIFDNADLEWLPDFEDFNPFGDFFRGLQQALSGLINPERLPFLPIGHIGQAQPNLLVNGDFAGEVSLDGEGAWTWDGTTGHTGPGSARTTGDGTRKILTSNSVECSAGQDFSVSGRVRWAGAAGSGATMRLALVPYIGATPQSEISIAAISSPAADSGGVFNALSGNYSAGAGVTSVRVRITVESALTAGTVWWDDMKLAKTATSLPQQWIQNLVGDLFDLDALAAGAQNLANAAQSAVNQIGEILMGAVVTPVTEAVQRFKDWFAELLGFQSTTTTEIKTTRNAVWAGVTRQEPTEDKSAEQLESALAALRSRAQATALENELLALGSGPVYDGPSSAGAVTVPIKDLSFTGQMEVGGGNTGAQTAGTAHTHPGGGLRVLPHAQSMTDTSVNSSATVKNGNGGTFIPTSTLPLEIVTFCANSSYQAVTDAAHVYLLSYNREADKWRVVSKSTNSFHSLLGPEYTFIDSAMSPAYTPSIGELMAVVWEITPKVTGGNGYSRVNLVCSDPKTVPTYHSVPYGAQFQLYRSSTDGAGVANELVLDQEISLPRLMPNAIDRRWHWGSVPYAQIGPDLGQLNVVVDPRYFYEDFNNGISGVDFNLFRTGATSFNPGTTDGRFAYQGGQDGYQAIVRRSQVATDHMRVEATLNAAFLRSSDLYICSDGNLRNYLALCVMNDKFSLMHGTGVSQANIVKTVNTSGSNAARWSAEYVPEDNTFLVFRGTTLMTEWEDDLNLITHGPGKRHGGGGLARSAFVGSGSWDDLLIYDVGE